MRDCIIEWVVAIIIAMLIMLGVAFVLSKVTPHPLIIECQKELPRDQHCKLIAVPEETENDR